MVGKTLASQSPVVIAAQNRWALHASAVATDSARRPSFSHSPAGDSERRNTCAAIETARQGQRVTSPKTDVAMAESIPKAKSAYAFFQAAMNKQMVGVPLG